MSNHSCKGRCSKHRRYGYYWQGFIRCSTCEVWLQLRNKSNKCHCCNSKLKIKPNSPRKAVRLIRLNENHVILESSNKVITKDILREVFSDLSFHDKITLVPESINNNIKIDTELLFLILNYFAGKKYRLTRPIGHGNEQITFIKQ